MKMKVANAVCEIVEAMLNRGTKGKILHIAFVADYAAYEFGGEIELPRTSVHLVFYRPNNYTRVFYGESKFPWLDNKVKLTMVSCHDSCWREDGVRDNISKTHRRLAGELRDLIEQKLQRALNQDELQGLRHGQPHYISIEEIKVLDVGTVQGELGQTFSVSHNDKKINIIADAA